MVAERFKFSGAYGAACAVLRATRFDKSTVVKYPNTNTNMYVLTHSDYVIMKEPLDTPLEIHEQIWKELQRATHDRHHPWRTPVLATVSAESGVNARTVVLRKAKVHEGGGGTLEMFTDSRSAKVSELASEPQACLVFWSARLRWQLRVRVEVAVHATGPDVDLIWQSIRNTKSALDYLGDHAPGSALSLASRQSRETVSTQDISMGYFAVLRARVVEMDWLELSRTGHRRARFQGTAWQWLKP
jgi:pyridoxamine 5'-phosphate oxidase